ncbi:FliA/WhiG family RNA polymerase sigma factor [Oceanotoga sp. DSM 15011]|jgi:RNA polymerase sigma factor for flagellar operon FliA|uniref:RNA polymerase sigma-28 (SigD/FliA/WhiG) subunit n=1 Tax=Oceanotoga teriensis TaxID=515440 RepID=A0AA45HI26_9BACT|nr:MULTISPECIES: FliA/WhiG family RNA polymerase sigma factor [Oceanotoga]MDO7977336.1 FliA/WhiG family RNA polymerase sigma factor [Oceanotoga teriensis]PWJ88727.1 RNA polymerase sigma-28 (SigD/FliA/WhiG) subunit [Oceanotoga teriensis]UYP00445.1 FliA/WhiG family RNA polymerase sigma factor [Oceanotoga sp. DSM 15011]
MNYRLDKDQVVKNFLPKIKVIALNLMTNLPKSVELDDLIQEGVIGLLQSYERYDPKHGATFYTYAMTRIRGAMLDYLRKIDWLPKEVRHLVKKYEEFLVNNSDSFYSDEEIQEKLNISKEELNKIKFSIKKSQILDLDMYILNHGEESIDLEKNDENDPEIIAYKEILKDELEENIKKLKEKEQLILSLYYEKGLTFKEIGEIIGVSESRISQIHSSIIIKLKTSIKRG